MKNKIDERIARIIHISALSQTLIELIENSIYEQEFKNDAKRFGDKFIKELDVKLNQMLGEDESAKQVLKYSALMDEGLAEAERDLIEILKEEKNV